MAIQGVRAFEPQAEGTTQSGPAKRYEILGYEEIPLDKIVPNPDNPRPSFHLEDDDPYLLQLGDSIRSSGQHRPAMVYEMVGGWRPECQNAHGQYMLLQGERRWRSSKLAGVDTLRCFIVRTPKNRVEEEEWLGVEDAFKEDWQPFFLMRFAVGLARDMDCAPTDAIITARTGLNRDQLRTAEKIMSLEPEIQAMVAEYEEHMYRQRQARKARGARGSGGRIAGGSGIRSQEFTPTKAAAVWDIFRIMRDRHNAVCNELSDGELQRRIAAKVSKSPSRDIEGLLSALREPNPKPGTLTQIAEFLQNPNRKLKDVVRATAHGAVVKHRKFIAALERIDGMTVHLTAQADQLGVDEDQLLADQVMILRTIRHLDEFERAIAAYLRDLQKR